MQVTRISTQVGQSVKSACVLTINCLKMVKIKLQWVFALLKMCCNSASSYCNRYIRNISKNVDFFFLLSCLLADFHLMRDTFQKKNRCERKKKVRTYTYLCKSKFFFRQQLLSTWQFKKILIKSTFQHGKCQRGMLIKDFYVRTRLCLQSITTQICVRRCSTYYISTYMHILRFKLPFVMMRLREV